MKAAAVIRRLPLALSARNSDSMRPYDIEGAAFGRATTTMEVRRMKTSTSPERRPGQLEEHVERTADRILDVLNVDWQSEHAGMAPETVSAIHCLSLRKVLRVVSRPLMLGDVFATSNPEIQSYDPFIPSCAVSEQVISTNASSQKPEAPARRKWTRRTNVGTLPVATEGKSENTVITPVGVDTE